MKVNKLGRGSRYHIKLLEKNCAGKYATNIEDIIQCKIVLFLINLEIKSCTKWHSKRKSEDFSQSYDF